MSTLVVTLSRKDKTFVERLCRRCGTTPVEILTGAYDWLELPDCLAFDARPGKQTCESCCEQLTCPDSKVKETP